jgi:hypothetical protein
MNNPEVNIGQWLTNEVQKFTLVQIMLQSVLGLGELGKLPHGSRTLKTLVNSIKEIGTEECYVYGFLTRLLTSFQEITSNPNVLVKDLSQIMNVSFFLLLLPLSLAIGCQNQMIPQIIDSMLNIQFFAHKAALLSELTEICTEGRLAKTEHLQRALAIFSEVKWLLFI